MNKHQTLDKVLGIQYPVIVAPMFLISNVAMIKAALDAGVTAAFPALNYRTDQELRDAIAEIKEHSDKPFGVNLIVNKSNPKYKSQLKTLIELKVDYIITSLGSPKDVIEQAHTVGAKVFCDVIDLKFAKKVEELGADGIIAVNNRAGGHCGNLSPADLLKELRENCSIPIISAGGVANSEDINNAISMGAAGVQVGTIFIACEEAPISQDYKQAMVDYGEKDIILSTKISGTAITVINTPYVQQVGTKKNFLEWLLKKNKWLKKYVKMIIMFRGMKKIEKAALGATYQNVWVAGPAIESVKSIRPLKEIIGDLVKGL
ncbi:MAG: nitronate monooxygenase [Cyclobacteriaceae bacterium]|nr:nitronate monooxygenase [Cyclobacteriaceae bacterium]